MKNTLGRSFVFVFLFILTVVISMADVLTVPAAAFHSYSTYPSDIYFVATSCNSRWIYTLTQPDAAGYLYAPVNLPEGVRIDGITLYCRDNHASADIWLLLQKNSQQNETVTVTLFSVSSSGQSTAMQHLNDWTVDGGASRLVANNSYQYTLRIQFGAASEELKCFGAKITYHY
jgi:hypothetical protein